MGGRCSLLDCLAGPPPFTPIDAVIAPLEGTKAISVSMTSPAVTLISVPHSAKPVPLWCIQKYCAWIIQFFCVMNLGLKVTGSLEARPEPRESCGTIWLKMYSDMGQRARGWTP